LCSIERTLRVSRGRTAAATTSAGTTAAAATSASTAAAAASARTATATRAADSAGANGIAVDVRIERVLALPSTPGAVICGTSNNDAARPTAGATTVADAATY
jgi:hypothetical protein